jgi:hypothetical protein
MNKKGISSILSKIGRTLSIIVQEINILWTAHSEIFDDFCTSGAGLGSALEAGSQRKKSWQE